MAFRKKIKSFVNKRNLNPLNNRKKVGVILFATSIGLFFLFAGRLTYIVVGGHVNDVSLKEKTDQLYQGTSVVEAKRGSIYDRNGEVIAQNSITYKIKAILSDTYVSGTEKLYAQEKDFSEIASILNTYLDIPSEDVMDTLRDGLNEGSYQKEFGNKGKNISVEQKDTIEKALDEAGIKGVYFDKYSKRIYPIGADGVFASHLIGYATAKDEDSSIKGKLGLELAYNDILAGKNGTIEYQRNIYGNPLPGTTKEQKDAVDGYDLYTTIDYRLQNYLEPLMDQVYEELGPTNLTATLMKADTGEILAMSQRPSFNPETMEGTDDEGFDWQNLLVQYSFEPGSTMKLATVASAIDEGVFNPDEPFVSGHTQIEDTPINDWDNEWNGGRTLNMRQALSNSSNVGMTILEQKMPEAWQKHLERFGFGESTYSGLDDEVSGKLPTSNVVDRAMSSFGQAVGVTQMQMLKMFSAIANNGTMIQPHFISRMHNPDTDETIAIEPQVVGQPVSANAANTVLDIMQDVVTSEEYGTAPGIYSLEGYNISAKTGTAEISEGGVYQKGNYLYSTVLMYPSEDPEYILYLTVKQPQSYNNELAEIANPMMKRSMELLSVEDTPKETSTAKVKVPNYKGEKRDESASDARKIALNPVVLGSGGVVTGQSIDVGESVEPNGRIVLLTKGTVKMPDTTGWSKDELESLGKLLDIEVHIEGEGRCVSQSIVPDAELTEDSVSFSLSG